MTEGGIRTFTPETAFLTSEIEGVERPYTVATPDGAVLKLNTLRIKKQSQDLK